MHRLAMVRMFSPWDLDLYDMSFQTLRVFQLYGAEGCDFEGEGFLVIDVKSIISVVAMIPFSRRNNPSEYFSYEKLGFDGSSGGLQDDDEEEEEEED